MVLQLFHPTELAFTMKMIVKTQDFPRNVMCGVGKRVHCNQYSPEFDAHTATQNGALPFVYRC